LSAPQIRETRHNVFDTCSGLNHGDNIMHANASAFNDRMSRPDARGLYDVAITCGDRTGSLRAPFS
jgi:hypothetical protein